MLMARIIKSGKREFECLSEVDHSSIIAPALGNLLKGDENTIVVGDYVKIDNGVIVEVLPRKNEIFRLIIREQKKKVTASNCDLMVILNSASKPDYKRGIVDRFLVRAHQWNIEPVVVFNKMDQYDTSAFDIHFERDRLKELGISCFEISAINRQYQPRFLDLGIEDLVALLKNKTSIFLGQSGVGKSKTISLITDNKLFLPSNEIGKKGKGTHTTTWSEIINVGEFSMIDSPGIRSFGVDDLEQVDLLSYFPDIEKLAVKCKFTNCNHAPSTTGCYFTEELDYSDRKAQLIASRLESYLKMQEEIAKIPAYLKK